MEAKDLMIGDWVMVYPWDETPWKPKRITDINFHSWEGAYFCDSVGVEGWDELSLDQIKPIPLTEEILEKNGFGNGRLNVSPQYYFEDNDVFIGVTLKDIPDKHKGIDIAKGKLYFQYDISYVEEPIYVHLLQHILRLCGIEKEIIL